MVAPVLYKQAIAGQQPGSTGYGMIKQANGSAPTSILITGASSGIGRALALEYAAPGVTLFLSGRDMNRLQNTVSVCEQAGATVFPQILDVTDAAAMRHWIDLCDDQSPLDLVVANAGISGGSQGGEKEDQARRIFDINLRGTLNTVHPALDRFAARRRGQVALVSSLAGYRGLPSAPAYSASKSAVKAYGEALRGSYRPSNVSVNVICPGFVKSRITDANNFPMPFLMDGTKAAKAIRQGLARDRTVIAFPSIMRLICWTLRSLPGSLAVSMLSALPAKQADKMT